MKGLAAGWALGLPVDEDGASGSLETADGPVARNAVCVKGGKSGAPKEGP
jgi:hypothetical protein